MSKRLLSKSPDSSPTFTTRLKSDGKLLGRFFIAPSRADPWTISSRMKAISRERVGETTTLEAISKHSMIGTPALSKRAVVLVNRAKSIKRIKFAKDGILVRAASSQERTVVTIIARQRTPSVKAMPRPKKSLYLPTKSEDWRI